MGHWAWGIGHGALGIGSVTISPPAPCPLPPAPCLSASDNWQPINNTGSIKKIQVKLEKGIRLTSVPVWVKSKINSQAGIF